MSFFSSIVDAPGHLMHGMGEMGEAAGSHVGGMMHAGADVAGGIGHGMGDVAGGVMHGAQDAAHDMSEGAHHAWQDASHGHMGAAAGDLAGGAMHGMAHAGGDILHGLMDGASHVGGGVLDGAKHIFQGEKGMLQHLIAGGKELGKGFAPIKQGMGIFKDVKGAWDLMHGKGSAEELKHPMLSAGEHGLNAIKELFGGDKEGGHGEEGGHDKKEEKDGLDKGLDMLKSGVGGVKSLVQLPEKFSGLTNTIGKVITEGVPGAGMIEKLSGGMLKESMLAEKAASVLKPLHGFLEKGGEKILGSGLGSKLIEKVAVEGAEKGASKLATKFAGKIVPGLNMATAAISAFQSGKSAYESFKKGDVGGAVIEGFHTLTNIAGGLPIPGAGLISVGGDIVSGAAHWLKDGGAKKIGEFASKAASTVGGAVSGAAKAIGDSPVGQFAKGAGKAIGGAVSNVGKSVGKLASGALSGAKKIFSGW